MTPVPAKEPFDIDAVMRRIAAFVADLPKAAMFELADDGYRTVFQQVVACIISARTKEEVTGLASRRLFARASTPEAVAALSVAEIDRLISPATFHEPKAAQIHRIAERTVVEFGGELPCDEATLLDLNGVGPKCAHLTLGVACGLPFISVDIHVHRVTNRWGYVAAKTPEATMVALEAVLPERYWVSINRLLVPFGKYHCTGDRPKCSSCPVLLMCRQVEVVNPR
jgi:endonuclease-3